MNLQFRKKQPTRTSDVRLRIAAVSDKGTRARDPPGAEAKIAPEVITIRRQLLIVFTIHTLLSEQMNTRDFIIRSYFHIRTRFNRWNLMVNTTALVGVIYCFKH